MIAHNDGVMMFGIWGRAGVGNPSGRGGDAGSRVECSGVIGIEVVKVERYSGVVHDPLDDGLAGDGTVVRDVIIHTAIGLAAEDAASKKVPSFVNIYQIRIRRMTNQMAPRHHLSNACIREVLTPSICLFCSERS